MLAKIEMEIEGNGLDVNMSSLFHGYLMNSIDSAYADYLHYNETHPYTSCIYKDMESGKIFWKITTFNKNAYEMLIKYFLENDVKNIYLEKKGIEVFVKSVSMKKTSFDELFFNDEKKSKIYFLTPTTHKSNGVLQIFPNISTLLLGVVNKINQHSDTIKLEDENVINELLEKSKNNDIYTNLGEILQEAFGRSTFVNHETLPIVALCKGIKAVYAFSGYQVGSGNIIEKIINILRSGNE